MLPHLLPYFTELEELSILLLKTVQREAGVGQTAATLFSSLTPLTTLVCPALRFIGLEAGMDHMLRIGKHRGLGPDARRASGRRGQSVRSWAEERLTGGVE